MKLVDGETAMNRNQFVTLRIAAALLALSYASLSSAQDAPTANPATVHATLENDKVRVLESALPPGAKEKIHSHPACVIYVIEGGKGRNHAADGTTTDFELKTGATLYREPVTHWTENIGATTIRSVIVELKSPH